MDGKKVKASLLAVTTAAAIALTGTFAWQSVNQDAINETEKKANPGGRLHDDFNGYGDGTTKDVYVENFGEQTIYARVRLDEYMEIGEGAGLKQGEVGYVSKKAEPLVASARIDQPSTWSTHIPGSAAAHPFHDYWTWTLGGEDTVNNPDGKTVYMPTFNKNKDSLKADINGTFDGLDPTDEVNYDDYVQYATDSAGGVTTKTAAEYADADADATDECGPQGGPGGTGVVDVNYTETLDVTHTAKETLNGKVLTMAEWKALGDTDPADGTEWKGNVNAWVYDADGWAYWSQPIAPNTATGLLLDKIDLTTDPNNAWYYAINAVAQFVTADDLGRYNSTGFYDATGGSAPTDDALALLDFIGVDTASVEGAITITATAGAGAVTTAVPGKTIKLSATVSVPSEASLVDTVKWSLVGDHDVGTSIDEDTGILTVSADEPVTNTLRIMAQSTAYDGLKGQLTLPVQTLSYTVDIKNPGEMSVKDTTVTFTAGSDGIAFTVSASPNLVGYDLGESWTWTSSDTTLATLSADTGETVTVTAASTAREGVTSVITATNGSVSASFTVKVVEDLAAVTAAINNITPGLTETVTMSGIEWYVVAKDTVTGKANDDIAETSHNAALLLSKNVLEALRGFGSDPRWMYSSIRTYLNGDFLTTHSTVNTQAVQVDITTRQAYNSSTFDTTSDKVFLLSSADVCGQINMGSGFVDTIDANEYTYNGVRLSCFASGAATADTNRISYRNGSASTWLLRSPSYNSYDVDLVIADGTVSVVQSGYSQGVRPAFWYDLDEAS